MKLHFTTVEEMAPSSPQILTGGTRFRRMLMQPLLLLLACFAAVVSWSAQPATNSNRFLFIVDTSASMKPFDKAVRETVFDFVVSGVRGLMTNNDTYGIWLVGDQNDTSFSMTSWGQRFAVELGAKATAHVKDRGYQGKARLDLAFADALRILKHVGDLTIVLISNGETPIAGTAFDSVVNERFRQLAPEMKRAKLTLNTVFVGRDGEVVAWAANTPDFLVAVPNVPPRPKVAARMETNASAASSSNPVANAVAPGPVAATNVEPPRPRSAPVSIIITKETVAQERRAFQAMAMTGITNESSLASAATNSNVAQADGQTNAASMAAGNATNVGPLLATAAEQQSNTVTAIATNRPATITEAEPAKSEKSESSKAAAVPAVPARVAKGPAPGNAHASPSLPPALWVGMGAGGALMCVFVLAIIARSRRQGPSLISQTMGRERIESPKI